jgi:aspartokinase
MMFKTLAEQEINIKAISTSISTVSCVIDLAAVETGHTALKHAFDLP